MSGLSFDGLTAAQRKVVKRTLPVRQALREGGVYVEIERRIPDLATFGPFHDWAECNDMAIRLFGPGVYDRQAYRPDHTGTIVKYGANERVKVTEAEYNAAIGAGGGGAPRGGGPNGSPSPEFYLGQQLAQLRAEIAGTGSRTPYGPYAGGYGQRGAVFTVQDMENLRSSHRRELASLSERHNADMERTRRAADDRIAAREASWTAQENTYKQRIEELRDRVSDQREELRTARADWTDERRALQDANPNNKPIHEQIKAIKETADAIGLGKGDTPESVQEIKAWGELTPTVAEGLATLFEVWDQRKGKKGDGGDGDKGSKTGSRRDRSRVKAMAKPIADGLKKALEGGLTPEQTYDDLAKQAPESALQFVAGLDADDFIRDLVEDAGLDIDDPLRKPAGRKFMVALHAVIKGKNA